MNIYRKKEDNYIDVDSLSIAELESLSNYYDALYNDLSIMKESSLNRNVFWQLFNMHYSLGLIFEPAQNIDKVCKELGIKYQKLKTKYVKYIKEKLAYFDRVVYLFSDWYIMPNKDIDPNRVYNDREIREMLANRDFVILNSNNGRNANALDYELSVTIDGRDYYKSSFDYGTHYLTECSLDLDNYRYTSSEKIMDSIRDKWVNEEFIDSEMEYARNRSLELLHIAASRPLLKK